MIALPRKRGVTRRDRALPNRRALLNESVSENVQSRRRSARRVESVVVARLVWTETIPGSRRRRRGR